MLQRNIYNLLSCLLNDLRHRDRLIDRLLSVCIYFYEYIQDLPPNLKVFTVHLQMCILLIFALLHDMQCHVF